MSGRATSLLFPFIAVLLVVLVLAGALGVNIGPLRPLHDALLKVDELLYDQMLCTLPLRPATGRVLIVAIDRKSVDDPRLGRWPWPRSVHARLLDRLRSAGAEAVLFDAYFVRPTSDDAALVAALRANGRAALVVGESFDEERGEEVARLPLPEMMDAAKAVGFNVLDGGTVRQVQLVAREEPLASFNSLLAVGAVMLDGGDPNVPLRVEAGARTARVGGRDVPLRGDWVRVNYRVTDLPAISYVTALEETLPDLKGRAVVVAATFENKDTFPVPCAKGARMPGGVILATALDMVLAGDTIRVAGTLETWLPVVLASVPLVLVLRRYRANRVAALAVVVPPLVVLTLAALLFYAWRVWFPVLAPVLTVEGLLALVYVADLSALRKSLARLVPQRVSRELQAGGRLASREAEATILFQDIAGYTTMAERMRPGAVLELLNRFFGSQQRIIDAHGGSIMDYQGDAQMLMFGGDDDGGDHAREAVDAAWELWEWFQSARDEAATAGVQHPQRFGIGIATGQVAIGNLGGAGRAQYSALGDTTNVAARLQGLTRSLEVPILVTEKTWERVEGRYESVAMPDVGLKGREEAVTIYNIMGRKAKETAR